MADENRAVFVTELKAEGVPETQAQAKTIEKLRGELDKEFLSLNKMQLAYKGLRTAGLQTTKMGVDLKNRILEQKKAIGQNQVALLGMKGGLGIATDGMKKTGAAAKGASSGLSALAAGASIAGGPVSGLTSKTQSLVGTLGRAGLIGVTLAAVAALVVFDLAVAKSVIGLAKMAVSSADAYRSERLSIEGMTKVWRGFFGIMQRAPGNAAQMQSAIDDVSNAVPITRDRVVALNAELYRFGLRGQALKQSLEAVALGESAAGDEGRQMGINMVAGAAMFGRSVTGAAAIMKSKFGPIVQQQMLALPVQIAKARYGFNQLFTGLKVEPLLRGLHNVLGLFSKGTETSKAWRAIFGTFFDPLSSSAEKGSLTVKRFLQGVTIVALEAAIKFKTLKGVLSFKNLGLGDAGQLLETAINGVASLAVGILRAGQATLVLADGLTTVIRFAQVAGKLMQAVTFHGGIGNQDKAWQAADDAADAAYKQLVHGSDTLGVGFNMIQGLIDGIEKGKPALIAAARAAQQAANDAVKTEQQIHSPSKKWERFGLHLTQGESRGMKRGQPELVRTTRDIQRATFDVGGGAGFGARGAAFGGGGRASSGGGQAHPTIGQLHLHGLSKSDKVTLSIGELTDLIAQALEGLTIQQGAAA